MKGRLKILTIFMAILFVIPAQSFAQSQSQNKKENESPLQVRNAMGTILLSGLVGGIGGLSTLSFYSRPQDHISNIFYGIAGGMIIATLWMTFDVATTPMEKSTQGISWAPDISPKKAGVFLSYTF